MDYKYTEQLLERYWLCETSLEEERILRAFFCQENVPDGLRKYKSLFALEKESMQQHSLGDDFDKRMLELVGHSEPQRVKAVRISLQQRMMPLFKAAAVVAIIVSLGGAAQFQFGKTDGGDDINYADYKDTFSDPAVAYDQVEGALEMVSEGFCQSESSDSLASIGSAVNDNTKRTE